jgi:hypothetical protein
MVRRPAQDQGNWRGNRVRAASERHQLVFGPVRDEDPASLPTADELPQVILPLSCPAPG